MRPTSSVTIEGGTVGDLTLEVSDMPVMEEGDRAVVFLEDSKKGGYVPHRRGSGVMKVDREQRRRGHRHEHRRRPRGRQSGSGGQVIMKTIKTLAAIAALGALAVAVTPSTLAYVTYGKWGTLNVSFYVNPANADVSANAAISALQGGMSAWNTQSGTSFRFAYAGQTGSTSTGNDGKNVILFRNVDNGGSIATTYAWSSNGVLVDSDIVFWDGGWSFFTGSSGCNDGAYIEDIATHELGHSMGLKHSSQTDATMYSTYNRCSTSMRTLSADDIAGAKALYAGGAGAPDTPPTLTVHSPTNGAQATTGSAVAFSGVGTGQPRWRHLEHDNLAIEPRRPDWDGRIVLARADGRQPHRDSNCQGQHRIHRQQVVHGLRDGVHDEHRAIGHDFHTQQWSGRRSRNVHDVLGVVKRLSGWKPDEPDDLAFQYRRPDWHGRELLANADIRDAHDYCLGHRQRRRSPASGRFRCRSAARPRRHRRQAPTSPSLSVRAYKDKRNALVHWAISAKGGWPSFPTNTRLKPNQQSPVVPSLRRRLAIEGDLDPSHENNQSPVFDATVVDAVETLPRAASSSRTASSMPQPLAPSMFPLNSACVQSRSTSSAGAGCPIRCRPAISS